MIKTSDKIYCFTQFIVLTSMITEGLSANAKGQKSPFAIQ